VVLDQRKREKNNPKMTVIKRGQSNQNIKADFSGMNQKMTILLEE